MGKGTGNACGRPSLSLASSDASNSSTHQTLSVQPTGLYALGKLPVATLSALTQDYAPVQLGPDSWGDSHAFDDEFPITDATIWLTPQEWDAMHTHASELSQTGQWLGHHPLFMDWSDTRPFSEISPQVAAQELITSWPTLYNNQTDVLNHLLVERNSSTWIDGCLVDNDNIAKYGTQSAFVSYADSVTDAVELDEHSTGVRAAAEHRATQTVPPHASTISAHSALNHIPDNISDQWLDAVETYVQGLVKARGGYAEDGTNMFAEPGSPREQRLERFQRLQKLRGGTIDEKKVAAVNQKNREYLEAATRRIEQLRAQRAS